MNELGDVVTGAMLARAVEPEAGEPGADGHTHESACLNCKATLTGPFCIRCGQKAHVHRSLRAFGGDFVAGLFNFEGKIWRTLPMLAWRPGDLTRRYIEGERARFVSPVALFLFTVFATFAVLSFSGAMDAPDGGIVKTNVEAELKDERDALARLEQQRKTAVEAKTDTAAIDEEIADQKEEIIRVERVQRGEIITIDAGDGDKDDTPQWIRDVANNAQKNPEKAVLSVWDAASKYSWLLIPISVPFMWLLFPFYRRYRLYDHTVFVTYSLSFMLMLVIFGGLLVAAGQSGWAGVLGIIPPFHMYRQLKGAYRLRWWSALLRTVALVTFATIAASLFMLAVFAIGLM